MAIEELIQKWQAAQAAGDLQAYKALYWERFFGVRRAGAQAYSFGYASWMKDREQLFRKPQRVDVTGIEVIALNPEQATVRFTQQWSAGRFHESGIKELRLDAAPSGLRISREELLVPSGPSVEAEEGFLHFLGDSVVLVKDAPESWSDGPPQRIRIEDTAQALAAAATLSVAVKRLRRDMVPARLLSWQRRRLRLFDLLGQVCEATVGELQLASALYVDDGYSWSAALQGEPNQREVDSAIWKAGKKVLVARIQPVRGDCKKSWFARAAELPVPKISAFLEADEPLRSVGLQTFRAHPLFTRIQASWERAKTSENARPRQGSWDDPGDSDTAVERQIETARHPLQDGYLLSARAYWNDSIQGRVNGVMWTVWEVHGTSSAPILRALNQPEESLSIKPLAALDVDGDGRLEFLGNFELLRAPKDRPLAYAQTDYLILPRLHDFFLQREVGDSELGGPKE